MFRRFALYAICISITLGAAFLQAPLKGASEARLVRYPDYHAGKIAFTYLGDVWTADENGRNVQRLTVNKARDVYPRFSPDGKWIAFSSDRNGNLDVYVVPSSGGSAKALTSHSADDTVLGWTPDSQAVLFASNRAEDWAGKLYTVGLAGGMPKNVGADMGIWASYSPDGSKLAINRHGQVYWRKYYRGANQTDVTIMDVAAKAFADVTDFKGLDSWPLWGHDGNIYFVSDREGNGLTNIWRVADRGGAAEQVTTFKTGDVRWPSISSDGNVVMFEHDFGIWKLDVATRKATPISLEIAADQQENEVEVRTFSSQLDDYSLEPAGHRIAFSVHGEIFTAPTDEGDLTQITNGPARDRDVAYSPDGKRMAYVSDRSGREEIYVASVDGAGEVQKITDLDALKLSFVWSPDSKAIAYVSSDNTLRRFDIDTRKATQLSASRYGSIGAPAWSPDGQWIAFSKADQTRTNDIYLVPASGGEERKATFDSSNDGAPRFAPNGQKLYFLRAGAVAGGGRGAGAAPGGGPQLFAVTLEREDRDPDDPIERRDDQPEGRGQGAAAAAPPKTIAIDWAGLKRRTRQITRMPFGVTSYGVSPDSRTIAFVTTEPAAARTIPVLYTIQQDGKRLSRMIAGGAEGAGEDEPPAGGGGRGAGMGDLAFPRDGRSVFFREGTAVYSIPMPTQQGNAGQTAGAGNAPSGGREVTRRRVNFTVRVKVDRQAEWSEMFGDAWRTMKYRFYDPRMHGKDWDAMRAKYEPLVASVGDRQELLNIINEMIGELNASHTGAAPPPAGRGNGAVSTGYLGLDLTPDDRAGRYKVTHVYEDGPADKDWVKVSVGNYLLAIDGTPVKAGDEYWQLLNYRLNRKVEVTFNSKPVEDGAWKTRIAPIAQTAQNQLRYERWVKERRQQVDKLSGGRIGYLHIQAMDPPSLAKFEKELRENRTKEALVIDQRWNGGGNIEQELLAILVQREYQIWEPRGVEPNPRPFAGFFGPKVVLQNWRSASNAEMFPAGFRALGLGKVIGTPTFGAVIGTGSYSLIDGSTVRTPGVGVFLADRAKTNMENYGVQPDILVDNTPEDNLAGRDRQVEVAVQELLKQLGTRSTTTAQGSRCCTALLAEVPRPVHAGFVSLADQRVGGGTVGDIHASVPLRTRSLVALAVIVAGSFVAAAAPPVLEGSLVGRQVFPATNWWNEDITAAPVDPASAAYISFVSGRSASNPNATRQAHPDFGPSPYGIPYVVVSGDQPLVIPTWTAYGDESDNGAPGRPPGYPIPEEAKTQPNYIEGAVPGGGSNGDRHLLIVDKDNWLLYETGATRWNAAMNRWEANCGAIFNLSRNDRRPETWTSADAAGLAIFPGLVRYDEAFGTAEIQHAFRVTVRATNGYVWPASHRAGSTAGALPMGARLRMKASKNLSGYAPEIQRIFRAMQRYGLIVADNGSDMYVSGTMDGRWNNDVLNPAFHSITADDFEVIKLGWEGAVPGPPTNLHVIR